MAQIKIKADIKKIQYIFVAFLLITLSGMTAFGQSQEPYERPLTIGERIEHSLKGGEVHFYTFELKQGQVLYVNLQEKGANVRIRLADVSAKKIITQANFSFGFDKETATIIAEKTDEYVLAVISLEKQEVGNYELIADVMEVATIKDNERIKALNTLSKVVSYNANQILIKSLEAINSLEKVILQWRELGDNYWEAYSLTLLGLLQATLGKTDIAIDRFNQSLEILQGKNFKYKEAQTKQFLALLLIKDKKKSEAINFLNDALPLFIETDDKASVIIGLSSIAFLYQDLREKEKAESFGFTASLLQSSPLKDIPGFSIEIGSLKGGLGNKYAAIEIYKVGLIFAKALKDISSEINLHLLLGSTEIELENLKEAEKEINIALEIGQSNNKPIGVARSFGYLSKISLIKEKYKDAVFFVEKALSISKANSYTNIEMVNQAGKAYSAVGEKKKAFTQFNEALVLSKKYGAFMDEIESLRNLMLIWNDLENPNLAIFYGKLAVNSIQVQRSFLKQLDANKSASISPNLMNQKLFLKDQEIICKQLFEILIKNKRLTEVQELLYIFRDQQYFDIGEPSPPGNIISDDENDSISSIILSGVIENNKARFLSLTQRERTLTDSYAKVGGELEKTYLKVHVGFDKVLSDEESKKLDAAATKFASAIEKINADFTQTPTKTEQPPDIKTFNELQKVLKEFHTSTNQIPCALYTLIGQDKLYILVVYQGGEIKAFENSIKSDDLKNKIKQFYGLLQSDKYNITILGKELYNIIFKPVEAEIAKSGAKTLMWSLDGNLRYIPMAALFDGEKFMVERYNNVVFTRSDGERMTRAVSPVWTGTGFGSTKAQTISLSDGSINFKSLPGVMAELRGIFKTQSNQLGIVKGEVLPDEKFNQKNMLNALKAKRPLVHIASHFSFRPGDEARSFLLMGDGTAFTLADMKEQINMFAGVELLTLSACNTAAQQADANGREIDGFAELAQRLGAGSVMATLWQVADNSTPWLMREFYNMKLNKNLNKAEALRQAQLSLLHGTSDAKPITTRTDLSPIKIVIVETAEDRKQQETNRGTETLYIEERIAPLYVKDKSKPFAHPFYWSPFILFGNWK